MGRDEPQKEIFIPPKETFETQKGILRPDWGGVWGESSPERVFLTPKVRAELGWGRMRQKGGFEP